MQPGDTVKIGGKEVQIVTRHASGKHTQFGLSDGTSEVDLHLRSDVVRVQKEGHLTILKLGSLEHGVPARDVDFERLARDPSFRKGIGAGGPPKTTKDILPHADFGEDSHD